MKGIKLINGDCLEVMDKMIEKGITVDAIITDPPYLINGNGFKAKAGFLGNRNVIDDISNIKDGFDFKIIEKMIEISNKINFYIYCNKDLLTNLIVYFKAYKERKIFLDILCEHISNPTPFCNTFLNDTDYILFVRESGVKINGGYKEKIKWTTKSTNVKDKRKYKHPTPKYVNIIEKYIFNATNENDIILDPFMGSCTTGVACINTNRKFIGIELDKEYYEISKERIKKAYREKEKELF